MPSERRSKEDTWTPNELKKALGKDAIRKEREERKKERLREDQNGDERHRRKGDVEEGRDKRNRDRDRHHRNEDDDRRRRKGSPDRIEVTEDERERQRRERREKREGKSKGDEDDSKRRRHKDDDREKDDRRKHRDGDDRRRHRDDDDRRKHRDDDDRRKHRDDDDRRKHRDDDDRRKHRDDDDRRKHRDDDGRRKHRDDDDRRHHRDDDEKEKRRHKDDERRRHRDEDDRERRKHRDDDDRDRRKEKKDRDRHKGDDDDERERQRRERREKKEGKDSRDKDRHRDRDEDRERRHREDDLKSAAVNGRSKAPVKEEKEEEEENDYGGYEDDFEDYEEDFEEEEDDDQPQGKRTDYEYSDDEMNQVLRALDEENDRLYKDSKKKDSRYDRDSSPEDDRGRGYRDRSPDENVSRHRPRTAINFASAKKRVMSQQAYGKTSKRAQDLFQMIELDTVAFDVMDLPPVKEYELYIRSYGRSDTRQAYVQTNDDAIDRDIQTEEIDQRSKWTQHPAEDFAGSGRGDGEKDFEDEEQSQQNKHQDLSRLSKFIQQAGQVMSILLDEERSQEKTELSANKSNISMSEGYTELSRLPLLKGRHVENAYFAPTQPNMLLTVYSQPEEDVPSNPTNGVGIICVWNTNEPSYPQRILACESQPRCCCFSPYKTSIAFAGMVDGSICAWDLREPPSLHKSVEYYKKDHLLRFPTYNTAGIAESDNHISPVTTINPAVTYFDESSHEAETTDDSGSGMSFQLVSSEDQGRINFWVVAELSTTDQAGSEIDLGLSPGGKIKVVISSTIKLENLMREARLLAPVRSFEMQISPTDPNHFYIGTDGGYVLHGLRFGNRAFPRTFSALTDSPVDVKMIDFSPFGHPCFLATTADGVVHLFGTKTEKPLLSWPAKIWGTKNILCAKWSRCRPCVFYVLDDKSHLYTFDILELDSMPSKMEPLSEQKVKHIAFTSYIKVTGRLPQMLVSHEDGTVQIHTISKDYREQQTLENDFLPSYLQKF